MPDNNLNNLQPNQSTYPSQSVSGDLQELFPFGILDESFQWDDVAQYQFNPDLQNEQERQAPYNFPVTLPLPNLPLPQTLMNPFMPQYLSAASAPPSPHHDVVPLRGYSTMPSLMSSSPLAIPAPSTPQHIRPASLPNSDLLNSAMPPFNMPLSYPYRTPVRTVSRARRTSMRTFEPLAGHGFTAMMEPYAPAQMPAVEPIPPRRERVPQTLEMLSPDRHFKVEFTVNGVPGVRVEDAIAQSIQLDAGDDRVFTSNGSRQIRLVIKWPGYADMGMYVPVKEDNVFVTRKRFAGLVGERIKRFVHKMSKTKIKEDSRRWKIANERGAISLRNLWLVSVTRASHNVWMAELEVQR